MIKATIDVDSLAFRSQIETVAGQDRVTLWVPTTTSDHYKLTPDEADMIAEGLRAAAQVVRAR